MATEPFIGEVKPLAFNFNPRGWAFCHGQILSIASNTALFSLLGTTYGGDGRTTFGLPDFRGRIPLGMGQGPGLSNYVWGQTGGASTATLLTSNLPAHTHGLTVSAALSSRSVAGSVDSPIDNVPAGSAAVENYSPPAAANANLGGGAANLTAQSAGVGQPFSKMPPYLTLNLCIALQGVFPARQ